MFEAFSGIGTQAMALKRLNVPYEIVGFSEIDKYAIKSYHAIHGDIKNYGDITKMTEIPSCDIFTWSFPCTDLSKAGKRQGMTKDTRSGLVYEVLRLVRDTKDKPKVLIMENVPDLIQTTFVRQFGEIQHELETYGYMNYVETLNSKDFGVAQNRNRVFMVSILGEYNYNFPKPFKLEKRLKDYLEHDVDEKFYLSEQFINYLTTDHPKHQRSHKFEKNVRDGISDGEHYANTITTREGNVIDSTYIKIPEDTKQGYALATDGDGVYINRPEQKRGVVQKGMIQTIKTSIDDIGVVDKLRIRKLTPRETWRLMGCSDEDFDKAQAVCSNSQLYKQAGNAIVVDVFEHILRGMI
jgi:DNA (cytosine-5)-methyltransferase 1